MGCLLRRHIWAAFLLVMLGLGSLAMAQTAAATTTITTTKLAIPRVRQAVRLADFLTMEPPAELAAQMVRVTDFIQQRPRDGEAGSQKTIAYLGYDERNLYIAFVCFDREPEKVRARMERREQAFDDDFVEVTLDTFHDRRRGYMFWSNPLGIQAEGIWTESEGEPDWSYDTLWQTHGQRTAQGYVVLMEIPFKSLRFRAQDQQLWSITLLRVIPRLNEWSFWPRISARVEGRLSQSSDVTGLQNISPGRSIQLIPYGSFRNFSTLDAQGDPALARLRSQTEADVGLDAKFVLKDNFVLDATVNPDFSQVESDQPQITTNQRFEVFFPERRPFFLENSDFFTTPLSLVFTRRIADPQFGLRLTGKQAGNSIGALIIDDQAPGRRAPVGDPLHGKRALFGVLRYNRDILNQSTIGAIFTTRQFEDSYNRVGGIDGRLKLNQNWVANYQAVASKTRNLDGSELSGPAYNASLYRDGRQFTFEAEYMDIHPEFRAATGFIPRTGIRSFNQEMGYQFRPEGKVLIAWGPRMFGNAIWDHTGLRLDGTIGGSLGAELIGNTRIGFFNGSNRERLRPQDFGSLTTNRDFASNFKGGFFNSSYFKKVTVAAEYQRFAGINFEPPNGQEPFLGDRSSGEIAVTLRPITRLRIDNTYLMSRLLDRYTGAAIFNNHILRSRWNAQFDKRLSLRVILQYDSLIANPQFTSAQPRKNFNADFLMTYQVNAWTALFVGYNGNQQTLDSLRFRRGLSAGSNLNQFMQDGRQFFVKFSYLFRL